MHWPGHRFVFSLFLGIILIWLIALFALVHMSALQPSQHGIMLVVFEPGISTDVAFAAITRAGAKPVRKTGFEFIWVVDGTAGKLEAEGALGAYWELPFSPTLAGCIAVADAKIADAFGL